LARRYVHARDFLLGNQPVRLTDVSVRGLHTDPVALVRERVTSVPGAVLIRIRLARRGDALAIVAGIAEPVAVGILLIRVSNRAVVAAIADPVGVRIRLVAVCELRAIVVLVEDAVRVVVTVWGLVDGGENGRAVVA
jgi:hypothetical protein